LRVIGFDFDQTLADSTAGIQDCLHHVAQMYGGEVDEEGLREIAESGLKLDPMLRQFLPEESIIRARLEFLDIYPQLGINGTQPKEGAADLLQKLRDARHKLVVISAKSQHNLELSIKHLHFEFDEIHGGASGHEKTECILRSKAQIYIGDQEGDVVAAKNAGVRAVFVNQSCPTFNLVEYPCDFFSSLVELTRSWDSLFEA
jgi:phosphoglycolate phosphatase